MNEQVMLRGLLLCVAAFCFPAASAGDTSDTGILVVAQDRGYMGNEETRAAFASVDAENKALIFITDKDSRKYLDAAVENFDADGTERLAVLPYFLSASHPGWQMAENWLRDDVCKQFSCAFSKPFGRSYYAIDVLDQALAKMSGPADKHLVVLGSGADSDAAVERMAQEWQHLAMSTDAAGRFAGVSTFVWNSDSDDAQTERLKSLADDENTVIAGYNFGWKFDSMMSLGAMLEHRVARDIAGEVMVIDVPAQTGGMWMQREANRNLLRGIEDIGVVIHAHGATFHWNERMRQAVVPLHEKYAVEYAFSMADRPTIETALKRLEARGMRAAVVVRVFGREDSFRSTIEKLLGMDLENREPGSHTHHGGHTGHGGHMMMGEPDPHAAAGYEHGRPWRSSALCRGPARPRKGSFD